MANSVWRPRTQRGQAIVLIALMLTILVGMAALAIDGSRAYGLRRDLQAAVDAAALAAGDRLQQTGSYPSAEQAATTIFGIDMHLYAAPSCSTPYGVPGATPLTVSCSYSDGTLLTQVVSALGPQGSQFSISASRSLALQFARILSSGVNPTLAAGSTGGINNLAYAPVVAALNQAGCGGAGGIAVSINGGGTLNVNGDVVSNGAISISGASMRVAGDTYARCQSSISGATNACYPSGAPAPCSYPDVAGSPRSGFRLVDPNYPPPQPAGGGQGRPGDDVVLLPGTYAVNPHIQSGRCYFLSGGVYRFANGYTSDGGFVSNELKPPDEPVVGNNQQTASAQFWNTNEVNCAGAFSINLSGNGGPNLGNWGAKITSVRADTYAGSVYGRESAPSRCRSFQAHAFQNLQLQVSNVPGAQSYNFYLSSNGCNGPFGLAGSLSVQGSVQNQDTSGCPFGNGNNQGNGNNGNGNGNGNNNGNCTLGTESLNVPALFLSALPPPNQFAQPGTLGAYPPDGETAPVQSGLPNQNPDRATPPAGDRANDNQCASIQSVAVACAGAVTPGAVVFSIPSGGCLNETDNSDNFVFSGYQYDWLSIYEPGAANPPANTCANRMGAASNSAAVGLVYMPAATVTVSSSATFETEATGGLMASQVTFMASPSITYGSGYAPVRPASRLVS